MSRTSEYHKWRLVIQYVHGKTIEELAKDSSAFTAKETVTFTEGDWFTGEKDNGLH